MADRTMLMTGRAPVKALPAPTPRRMSGPPASEEHSADKVDAMWFVIYAKIVDDKEKGLKLAGVFFGGTGKDKAEADKIARECVNTIKGGTILARLYQVSGQQELPRIMADAEEFFKKKEEQMATAAAILTRPTKKK